MNNETKQELVHLLKRYHDDMVRRKIFEYELLNHPMIAYNEIIEDMNFHREDNGGVSLPDGHITDKTFDIADSYKHRAKMMDNETFDDLESRKRRLDDTWKRLEFYLSSLSARQQEVIRLHYYEDIEYAEIAASMHLSEITVKRENKKAIAKLCSRYREMNVCPDLIGDPVDSED